MELVDERMREKPQVSSLDKNVLSTWCNRVMIGLIIKIINVQQNWYKISVYTKMPIYSRDIQSERFLQQDLVIRNPIYSRDIQLAPI